MIVTEIKSLDRINEYNVDALIVQTKYSAINDNVIDFKQLSLLTNKKIALKMDKAISEDEIIELEYFIKETLNYNIYFYIFTDMSVYYILKKYNIEEKAVYFAKTINCSSYDINEYNKMNIKCLISTELTIEDLTKISNLQNNFIYTYGYFNIFYSKRKLLSLYKQYANLKYDTNNKKYYLLEETRDEYYPVLENENGTFVFAPYIYLLFEELSLINKNNYFYINSLFLEEDDLINIINIYNKVFEEGFNNDLLNELKNINQNIGKSFLYLKPEILKENNKNE